MPEEMTKDTFIELLRSERERWEALLAKVAQGELEGSSEPAGWSLRDLIAHVTAYERGLVDWLQAARQGEVLTFADLDHPDVDYRNAMILEQSQSRTLDEVQTEADQVFRRLMALVEDTPEQALLDAEGVAWYVKPRWGEPRALWQCIADDSYRHYRQHGEDLRKLLPGEGESG